MPKLDRLSALMAHFELRVEACDRAHANFVVFGDPKTERPTRLCLTHGQANPNALIEQEEMLMCARFSWGGTQNPFLAALPSSISYELNAEDSMTALVDLVLSEKQMTRCGSASVLNRLVAVLIVRLMRAQIESNHVEAGLLAGLADPRLSRAIVAMHDKPGHPWQASSLAEEAGLSVSRFSELFRLALGVTPLAYLRSWRLTLAKQDIERGERLQGVANRYGYGSIEALSRACTQAFGQSPRQIKQMSQDLV